MSYDCRGISFTSYGGKLLPTPMLCLLGLDAGSVDLGDESSRLYLPIILLLPITEAMNSLSDFLTDLESGFCFDALIRLSYCGK